MLILIRSFILSNFLWVLLASTVASGFAGGYAVRTWYEANLASASKQLAEKRDKDHAKSNEIKVVVSRLPDGDAAKQLFAAWARETD